MRELGLEVDIIHPLRTNHSLKSVEGSGETAKVNPVFSVPEILETITEIGKRGMQLQRFKGLGEMNAKELFTTTMDPKTRQVVASENGRREPGRSRQDVYRTHG